MSNNDDDRKQRFRFHRDDEILLLEIVLRAKPCPYKISSRDGSIMVAWNTIAEEFKGLCKPRSDGKLPYSRTCRTRCDKMIVDYLAMQATPTLRNQKHEMREDQIKYELLGRLATLIGKGTNPSPPESTITNPLDVSTGPVAGLLIPGGLMPQGSTSTNPTANDPQLHYYSSPQQRGSAASQVSATAMTPQTLANIGNNNNQTGNQSTSQLLAASRILLSASGMSGINNSHSQDTSPDPFSVASPQLGMSSQSPSQPQSPAKTQNLRKRRANNNNVASGTKGQGAAATAPATASVAATEAAMATSVGQDSFNYQQRTTPSASSSTATTAGNNSSSLTSNTKRLRSGKTTLPTIQPKAPGAVNTYSQQNTNQQNNGHHSNHAHSSRSGASASEAVEVDNDDNNEQQEKDVEADNDDGEDVGGYQHNQDAFDDGYGGDYNHEADTPDSRKYEFASPSLPQNDGRDARASSKWAEKRSSNSSPAQSFTFKRQASFQGRNMVNFGAQRQFRDNTGDSSESSPYMGSGFGAGWFLAPSQMTAEDRTHLMRTLALEEQRVRVEVDKIALERERLALERTRLEWEMRRMSK
ncbi:hypothetical protein BG011_010060 [Mortierella polycephala]|uniref:Uncharacterized protein n=1 Tax=Mortierella polycephala TaxID=41804 RepID=A0A9P6QBB3_9FUNG|nr:hypothetical protein BG011_010060 [Mortierella polycephala]